MTGVDSSEALPVVGITTYREPASWGSWRDLDADLLPAAYVRAVERAGGAPVLLPPVASAAAARAAVARLDGLLVSGGADINPARYGQTPGPHVTTWYDDRDASELWMLAGADAADLPVLGICRGMQMMAVAAGGDLVQHLPDVVGNARNSASAATYAQVPVRVEPGHRISTLIADALTVPCHHHQAVHSHPGYVGTAHDDDGVLQAFEGEGPRFRVGVQWHPETADDPGLFVGFVAAAREYAVARGRRL